MLKSIPKSNIAIKKFPVHKEWIITDNEAPIITAYNEDQLFDPETSNSASDGTQYVYTDPLYNSIKTKYYNARGNVFNQYGIMRNPAEWEWERYFGETIYVIKLPQLMYGEQIQKGSVVLTDLENTGSDGSDLIFTDDSFGNIQSDASVYRYQGLTANSEEIYFEDQFNQYTASVDVVDFEDGLIILAFSGSTGNYYMGRMDHQTNILTLDRPLIFDDTVISEVYNGNVFYDDGLIVLTQISPFTNYELVYKSTQTIYETEVLVTINAGEFNFSQNPSAVNVTLENEYNFEVTKITNVSPAGTVRIKEIQDISRKPTFNGTYSGTPSGSQPLGIGTWDDYFEYGSTDPTGSYLTTYISTIGLYDENLNLVAIGKLPKPIKNLPNYDLNFLIRFDT